MKLIGTLDSPYVRRVAISLTYYGCEFKHQPLSVFSDFSTFSVINPSVKAPTLQFDDNEIIFDSSLILDYFENMADNPVKLIPSNSADKVKALRVIAFSLAACEKCIQIVYERKRRPVEKQHQPWLERLEAQLTGALSVLDREIGQELSSEKYDLAKQHNITLATSWTFISTMLEGIACKVKYPRIDEHVSIVESLPIFSEIRADEGLDLEKAKAKTNRLFHALYRS
ncbi:glutathione S-transferase N-terminal domain-containing protein [Marinobacter salarius]|uniref:glutathione S-transferase N-terminal domain-containing protein n=1 Tax=Marinobacter salarius TaxID=1420917 RepID=UPI00300B210D